MTDTQKMALTMGPVLFNWTPEKWRDFYFRMADEAPVDHIILGEIVCSKRSPFFAPMIPAVLDRLERSGKSIILGSPILVMNKRERTGVQELLDTGYPVELNDITALQALHSVPSGVQDHTIGPFINIYNEAAARFFEKNGAHRLSLPGELSLASIKAIAAAVSVPVEVFAFGRMPLAISARCYHARAHNLSKDGCQYVCNKDTNGLGVDTMDGTPFLAVNGVQTLSYTIHNVITDLPALAHAGVKALRLSPHDCDMVRVAKLFRDTLDGYREAEEIAPLLSEHMHGLPLSNGFLHGKEGFRARAMLNQ